MADALTRSMWASHVLAAVLVAAALAFAAIGAAIDDTFYLRLATEALIFSGLALSVDILLGYTGLLSLGQALYFGMGAYLSALVLMVVPSFWAAMGATLVCAIVSGLIGGFVANRVRGVYFALITFGMAQVAAKVVYNTRALGASDGLIGVPVIEINLGVVSISSASPGRATIGARSSRSAGGRPMTSRSRSIVARSTSCSRSRASSQVASMPHSSVVGVGVTG